MERIGSAVTRRLRAQVSVVLAPTFMAIVMSLTVSLVMTTLRLGFVPQLMLSWLTAFGVGAPVAIPIAVLVSPVASQLMRATVRPVYARLLIPSFMAVVMSLTMSLIMTMTRLGFVSNFVPIWLYSFTVAVIVAIPTAILVAPQAQRLANSLTRTLLS